MLPDGADVAGAATWVIHRKSARNTKSSAGALIQPPLNANIYDCTKTNQNAAYVENEAIDT